MKRPASTWQPGTRTAAFHRALAWRRREPPHVRRAVAWLGRLRSRTREHSAASGREQALVFAAVPMTRMDRPASTGPFQLTVALTTRVSHSWTFVCHLSPTLPAIARSLQALPARHAAGAHAMSQAAMRREPLAVQSVWMHGSPSSLVTRGESPMPLAVAVRVKADVSARSRPSTPHTSVTSPAQPLLRTHVRYERMLSATTHHAIRAASKACRVTLDMPALPHVARTVYSYHFNRQHTQTAYALLERRLTRERMETGRLVAGPARVEAVPRRIRFEPTMAERSAPDVVGATRVSTFSTAHVSRLRALERQFSASSLWRTTASVCSETSRLFARARSTEWRFDEPQMAVRRPVQAQPTETITRTQQRLQQDELIKTVRRTVVEESERAARHAARARPTAQHLAEDVYGLLTKRLVLERERLGR